MLDAFETRVVDNVAVRRRLPFGLAGVGGDETWPHDFTEYPAPLAAKVSLGPPVRAIQGP